MPETPQVTLLGYSEEDHLAIFKITGAETAAALLRSIRDNASLAGLGSDECAIAACVGLTTHEGTAKTIFFAVIRRRHNDEDPANDRAMVDAAMLSHTPHAHL